MEVIKQRKIKRLINSTELIINNDNIFNFKKYCKIVKELENTVLTEEYLNEGINFIRQFYDLVILQDKHCLKCSHKTNFKLAPHAFLADGTLINIIILPYDINMTTKLLNNYNLFIRYNLTFLNLRKCRSIIMKVNEFNTKTELDNFSILEEQTNFNSGYNINRNKFWSFRMFSNKIVNQNWTQLKPLFKNFMRNFSKRKREDEHNFLIDKSWVSASSTRDFALGDHLVAYLKHNNIRDINDEPMPYKRRRLDTTEDNKLENLINTNQTFGNFIMNKGNEFEDKIYNLLIQRYGNDIEKVGESFHAKSKTHFLKTIKLMKEGKPIIYQAVLQNPENKTYGCPDLLVRSDYLNKIVEEEVINEKELDPALKLNTLFHYRIVDIKFSTIELNSDTKTIRNYENSKAYKMQLLVYNQALNYMQGYLPDCAYILAKGWKLRKGKTLYKSQNPFKKLPKIDYKNRDSKYIEKLENGLEFMNKVKTTTDLDHDPPNCIEMYPNMNVNSRDIFQRVKTQIAEKYDEITLISNCSLENRNNSHLHNITSWKDSNLNTNIMQINGKKTKNIVQKNLDFNRKPYDSNNPIYPSKINSNMYNWKANNELEFYVDFETIGTTYLSKNRDIIFMVGVGYIEPEDRSWKFHSLYVNELTDAEEFRILKKMNEIISNLNTKYNCNGNVYHWSHAEKTQYNKAKQEYGGLSNINWADLVLLFRKEPILVHGNVRGFGLKKIAKQMKKLGLIDITWNENSKCMHGMNAMHLGYLHYSEKRNDKLFKEIEKYNEIDCLTMKEILFYLRYNNI